MSGDGRLELDEIGDIIDRAADLPGEPSAEVIADDNGRSWGERFEDSGISPWVRRHRRAVWCVSAAVAVVAAGSVAWSVLVPPPLDPELRVTVAPVIPSQYTSGEDLINLDRRGLFRTGSSGLRTAYAVTAQVSGDTATYAVTGLVGPGVRASGASPQAGSQRESAAELARADVDVVLDCFDDDSLRSTPGSYSLMVTRTDEWGRTLIRSVPLRDDSVSWPAYVAATCLQTRAGTALTATSMQVTTDVSTGRIRAEVTVASTLPVASELSLDPPYSSDPVSVLVPRTSLTARGTARLPFTFEVRDCSSAVQPQVYRQGFPGDDGYDQGGPGVGLTLEILAGELGNSDLTGIGGRLYAPLAWTPDQARALTAAIGSVCAGSPRVTLAVRQVGAARSLIGEFPSGNQQAIRFPVTLDIGATAGERVRLASPQASTNESMASRVVEASSALVGGRGRVATFVDVDCELGIAPPPPLVRLDVRVGDRRFPLQLQLNGGALTAALVTACGNINEQEFLDAGWSPPSA